MSAAGPGVDSNGGAGRRSRRRWWLLALGVGAAALLGACGGQDPVLEGEGQGPRILVLSQTWQKTVQPAEFQARVRSLTQALEGLRADTGSGWTGRQSDATGFLAEASGGRFVAPGAQGPAGAVAAFLEAYGIELFGVDPSQVQLAPPDQPDRVGGVALRGLQHVHEVPVLDGELLALVGQAQTAPAVNLIRGRVFTGLDPGTLASLDGQEAAAIAADASGGTAEGEPRLVVLAEGPGVLCWEVRLRTVSAMEPRVDLAYVDAGTGVIRLLRPASTHMAPVHQEPPGAQVPPTPQSPTQENPGASPARPESVTVQGTGPNGEALTAQGVRRADGRILLIDTTVPSYDHVTGEGGIETHDGSDAIPGPVWVSGGARVGDADAIAAHAFSRYIYDYFLERHGRSSWDGQGRTMVSSVHGTGGCDNAYFNGEQMVYHDPCPALFGSPSAKTLLDMDVAAHEITHGVTDSSSDLVYQGPPGALNEAFSDYFGNLIGNRWQGSDDNTLGEDACVGIEPGDGLCESTPEDSVSVRYMVGGEGLEDYLHALSPPYYYSRTLGLRQDGGGVHINSAIWNNAAWRIRSKLARSEGTTMLGSTRVRLFDDVMYLALTRYMTAQSGFLDARSAVEEAARALEADAFTLKVIRQTFDLFEICTGCVPVEYAQAQPVAVASTIATAPAVSGNRVAWLSGDLIAPVAEAAIGEAEADAGPLGSAYSVGFAGELVVVAQAASDRIVWLDPETAQGRRVDGPIGDREGVGLAGSEDGVAWINFGAQTINFMTPEGQISSAPWPGGIGRPSAIGTGGRTVAVGTDDGEVIGWKVGNRGAKRVGQMPDRVVAIDAHGDNIAALAYDTLALGDPTKTADLIVFEYTSGRFQTLSGSATFMGVTMSDTYVVWAQKVGALGGPLGGRLSTADSNLYLHSLATDRRYEVLNQRGQQGFPALSGNRLVWQDAVNGSDDVYTAVLEDGL